MCLDHAVSCRLRARMMRALEFAACVVCVSSLAAKGGFGAPAKSKKSKKKAAPVAPAGEVESYGACRAWATANGADVSGVVASEYREGLGRDLVAARSFKKGEIVARVPSELALALSDPGSEEADLASCGGNFFKFGYLNNEFFEPYVGTLPAPSEVSETPDYWSAEEVAATEWPELAEEVEKRKARVAAVAGEMGVSEDLVRYGAHLASSRSQALRLDAGGGAGVDAEPDEPVEVRATKGCFNVTFQL